MCILSLYLTEFHLHTLQNLLYFVILLAVAINQRQVVQKPVNANPGLKVNRSINFSCVNVYVSCSLGLPQTQN